MLLTDPATTGIRPVRAHCIGDVDVPDERIWDEVFESRGGLDAGQASAAVLVHRPATSPPWAA